MKVFELRDGFGLENLVPGERPDPEPGPGQASIALRAVSLNYRDLLMARGHYDPTQPLPLIPCSDGVGDVVAVGPGVTRVAAGDRVCPIFAQDWASGEPTPARLRSTLGGPLDGTLAERIVVDASGLVKVPPHLTHEEAATLPCAAVTAWSTLTIPTPVLAGETVLVQGTGGVSIFGLQLARLFGARVIVTSSDDAKLERAKELGAWQTINYRAVPDWGKRAKELTGGVGVDRVIEVGGAGTLKQSLASVRCGGQISLVGVLAGVRTELDVIPLLMRQIRIQGVLVGHREGFEAMNRAIATSETRPVVDRVFPFDEARAAFEHLGAARHFGKIVIRL